MRSQRVPGASLDRFGSTPPPTLNRGALCRRRWRNLPLTMPKKTQRERRVGGLELQVLASGTWDAPASLFLTSLQSGDSYLFNCGEGLQRFCQEHGLKMAGRLRRVLLTRLTWDAIGGLPGALLTMHSTDHGGALRVHGPAGVAALVSSFRHFVVRSALPAAVTEASDEAQAPPLLLDEIGVRATPLLLRTSTPLRRAAHPARQARCTL